MVLVTIINKDLNTLIPIIHEFQKKIKKHIIVYDEAKIEKKLAQKLKKGIKAVNKLYGIKQEIELLEIDEDSKVDMKNIQEKLSQEKDKLYLNATNSDISILLALSVHLLKNGGIVFSYDKYENSYNEIYAKGFKNHFIKNNLKLDEYFLYMNYIKLSYKKEINFSKNISNINYLFKYPQKLFLNNYLLHKKKLKFMDESLKNALIALKIIDKKLNLIPSHKTLGELFEEFIYNKLKKYNFDDIQTSVEIMYDEEYEIFNEFDIIAIKDNHLYIFECKFGTKLNTNDVIYKLDSVIENFGDDAKGMIVNIQQNFDFFDEEKFKNKLFSKINYKRANYNNLEIYNDYVFNEALFDELIKGFFNVELKENLKPKNQIVFLLGGYDLEMLEIKNLLIKHNKHFIDKKLSWGAKLSDYKEILNDTTIYYGIELIEDIKPPKNYYAIDHHNQFQNHPSAIEQVAKILNIELNRYQKLVALNDSGYIPAMEKFGATEVEIELIRKKDREAQGTTLEDEYLAEISIKNGKKIKNIFVIFSQTDNFTPITDKLYNKEKNILIYTNDKLNYYGDGINKLKSFFQDDIKNNKAYFGGNDKFFGIAKNAYKAKKIVKIKNQILDIL